MRDALFLAITTAGTGAWLERWAPLAEWAVAGGTALLALATFFLARRARDEAQAVRVEAELLKQQVELEAEQLAAGQRPLVVPILGYTGGDGVGQVLLTNTGAGPALNVRGFLWWTVTAGGASSLHPQVLGAGASAEARVTAEGADVNWANAVGFLRYHDLGGIEWQTHFRFRADGSGHVRVEILAAGKTEQFGEPAYNGEDGWVNKPDDVVLWEVAA
jgi:hypothetical protein